MAETPKKTVLVVSAHPDDEVLGCGGTIARHVSDGDDVHIHILCEGAMGRHEAGSHDAYGDELAALRASAVRAAEILGAQPPTFGGLPDNRLDSVDLLDVVRNVEAVVENVRPSIVYTHFENDLNLDHGITARAVLTACRPLPGAAIGKVYAFETVSSTEWRGGTGGVAFQANTFIDISPYLEAKLKALQAYEAEMRPFPHPRSMENIEALARVRGATARCEAAEAFVLIREVIGD